MKLRAVLPMLADNRKYPAFSHPDWLFEIKFGGYRMLGEFGAGQVRLRTRQGLDCTTWSPEMKRLPGEVRGRPFPCRR